MEEDKQIKFSVLGYELLFSSYNLFPALSMAYWHSSLISQQNEEIPIIYLDDGRRDWIEKSHCDGAYDAVPGYWEHP